jgi:hypothetical protein
MAWHSLQGSTTLNLTVAGTFILIYTSIARRAFFASKILSLGIETHFVELPSEQLKAYEEVVSRVTHSSDVVFSRTWHASSIKVLVEPKQVILKIFRL